MDFSSFFDYPDKSEDQNASPPLVFLGEADKASWEKLIDHCIRGGLAVRVEYELSRSDKYEEQGNANQIGVILYGLGLCETTGKPEQAR